jgi:hypothetical protein
MQNYLDEKIKEKIQENNEIFNLKAENNTEKEQCELARNFINFPFEKTLREIWERSGKKIHKKVESINTEQKIEEKRFSDVKVDTDVKVVRVDEKKAADEKLIFDQKMIKNDQKTEINKIPFIYSPYENFF